MSDRLNQGMRIYHSRCCLLRACIVPARALELPIPYHAWYIGEVAQSYRKQIDALREEQDELGELF